MIPQNQIVVVTGDPRSGTSLMMQTLKALGVPVAGQEWPGEQRVRGTDEEKAAHLAKMQEMNPGGFWEVPGVVMRGLPDPTPHLGKAIKIISPGVLRTPKESVYRYILCLRDPTSVAQSQTKLESGVKVAGVAGWQNPAKAPDPTRFALENGLLVDWFTENPDALAKTLVVEYDAFQADPAGTVAAIVAHLGLRNVEKAKTDEAVSKPDPTLVRSRDAFKGWDRAKEQDGDLAESVYAALHAKDEEALSLVKANVANRRDQLRREANRYYDPATGITCNTATHEKLKDDATFRDKWLNGFESNGRMIHGFKRELLKGLHPQCSPDFKLLEETTSIDRPLDKGNLDQPLCTYLGEKMTLAAATVKHQRLYAQGRVRILPLADRQKLAAEVK